MRTVSINVFAYDELSEQAKKFAYEEYITTDRPYDWSNEDLRSLTLFCEQFNLNLLEASVSENPRVLYSINEFGDYDSGFYTLQDVYGLRLHKWFLNNHREMFWEMRPQGKYMLRDGDHEPTYARRSNIFEQETECPFTGYMADDYLLDPIREFLEKPDVSTGYRQLMERCIESWKGAIRSDVEDSMSRERVRNYFNDNLYEFHEDGRVFHSIADS